MRVLTLFSESAEGRLESVLLHMAYGDVLGYIGGSLISPTNSIMFMPDGKGFATGSEDGNLRIYRFDPSYFDKNKFP